MEVISLHLLFKIAWQMISPPLAGDSQLNPPGAMPGVPIRICQEKLRLKNPQLA